MSINLQAEMLDIDERQRYLRSLDVNTVWLDSWNDMPDFLDRINPAVPPNS